MSLIVPWNNSKRGSMFTKCRYTVFSVNRAYNLLIWCPHSIYHMNCILLLQFLSSKFISGKLPLTSDLGHIFVEYAWYLWFIYYKQSTYLCIYLYIPYIHTYCMWSTPLNYSCNLKDIICINFSVFTRAKASFNKQYNCSYACRDVHILMWLLN